jgi:type IV secretion system protein VirD4
MLCQSVAQLVDLYGATGAETILGNCDTQLVLAFHDNATASAFAARAARTPDSLMRTPTGSHWLFMRGQEPRLVRRLTEEPVIASNGADLG